MQGVPHRLALSPDIGAGSKPAWAGQADCCACVNMLGPLTGFCASELEENSFVAERSTSVWFGQADCCTCVMVAVSGSVAAALAIADPLKPEARGVVAALTRRGLAVHLVTGDNWRTARAVASQLAIINVSAECLPANKAAKIRVRCKCSRSFFCWTCGGDPRCVDKCRSPHACFTIKPFALFQGCKTLGRLKEVWKAENMLH